MTRDIFRKPSWLIFGAALCASGVWLYANRVLIPYQVSDAAAHGRPRGNLSDLYLHWVGARELLLNGRNPYGDDVSSEIQQGYYGRRLDMGRAGDPRDQHFAYPVYDVFLLSPFVHLPFEVVRRGFWWAFFVLTLVTVPIWLRVLRWFPSPEVQASLIILTMGSLSVMQGLKLQQMTLLVAALIGLAMMFLRADHPVAAGMALAFSTIKPQLVWLLVIGLSIWIAGEWRQRRQLAASFVVTMAILCAMSEWYLRGWIPLFFKALMEYPGYTDAVSVLDKLLPWPWAYIPRVLAVVAVLYIAWKNRRLPVSAPEFAFTIALILAVTLLVIPTYALYNQILLLPGLLMLLRDWRLIWKRGRVNGLLLSLVSFVLLWQWLTCIVLAGLSFILPSRTVESQWAIPLWSVFFLPVVVAALMLVLGYQQTLTTPSGQSTS